jgi:flagellar basal-body rod modification protein FlgD
MAIAPVGSATAQSAASSAAGRLTSNFDTFLTLLTTQLKHQDPLSPMDSNQFTQQLVQFSQVEQQISSNQNLEKLISLSKNQTGVSAVSYLGKKLTLTDGTGVLSNGSALWGYSLANTAATANLVVTDSKGKTVYTAPAEKGEGLHTFQWDGKTNAGNALPNGAYTLRVTAKASDGTTIATQAASQGVVSEIDLTGSEPILMIGPVGVPLSKANLISGN